MNASAKHMSLSIRLFSRAVRPTTAENAAVTALRSRLEPFAPYIRRLGVRLEEVIDVDGHPAILCKVKVVLAKAFDVPSFVLEAHGAHVRDAVDAVADAVEREVRLAIEEAGTPPGRRASREAGSAMSTSSSSTLSKRARAANGITVPPEREGAIELEAQNPGKTKSANPPRGEHFHMTRHQARATSARELSATRPSRKSTRKSANRSKRDSNLERQVRREVRSPEGRVAQRGG